MINSNESLIEFSMKIIIALVVISGVAYAGGFGSAVKVDPLKASSGSTAEFSLLFWSDERKTIILEVEDSGGLDVGFDKSVVRTDRTSEMIYISDNYIPAATAKLYVRNAPLGRHNIIISSSAFPEGDQLSVVQERIFNLTLISVEPVQTSIYGGIEILNPLAAAPIGEIVNYVYIPLIIIIIAVLSLLIYKFA